MRKYPELCVYCFSFFLPFLVFGQTDRDNLLARLSTAREDSAKVILYIELADIYETSRQDSALYYLEKARVLAEELRFIQGIYRYHAQSSIVLFTMGNYPKALEHSNKAIELSKDLGDSTMTINSLANSGIVYQYLGQFEKQLEVSLQAMSFIESGNYTQKLSQAYHGVANAYFNLNQYKKSKDYCLLSLKTAQKYQGNPYLNRLLASLAQSYDQMKMQDSALYYYQLGIKESVKNHDSYAEAAIYGYMANTYADKGDFVSMLDVSEKSLVLAKALQSRQLLASSFYNLAYAQFFNQNQNKARQYIYQALEIASTDSLNDELKNIYSILSYIAAREGDFKTLLSAKMKTDSIQKAHLNEEVLQNTMVLSEKYESEKRDQKIRLQKIQLQQRNTLNYLLIGTIAALLIVSLLFYRNYLHKQTLQTRRINELETEKKLMAAEAVLKGEEQERGRIAKDLHDGLGGMLSGIKHSFNTIKGNMVMTENNRQIFERGIDLLDSSIQEMRRVAHNMMPESLIRFGLDTALRDYCNDIDKSGTLHIIYQSIGLEMVNIDQTIATTTFRIVQELIVNILKHAGAKTAIVQLTQSDEWLSVTVEDDGKGMDLSILDESRGIGWTNIKHRVDFLKGSLDIHSEPGKGTSVHIEFHI